MQEQWIFAQHPVRLWARVVVLGELVCRRGTMAPSGVVWRSEVQRAVVPQSAFVRDEDSQEDERSKSQVVLASDWDFW